MHHVLRNKLDEARQMLSEVYNWFTDVDFHPTPEIQERVAELLAKNREGELTPAETAELDEYEHIENFLRKLKIRALKDLQATS